MAMDLEGWLETWRGALVGLLASWGTPWDEARALAQEVFAQAWLARERFRGDPRDPQRAGPWLHGIARNVHRAWLRERERARRQRATDVEPDRLPAPPAREEDARLQHLRAAIDALRPQLREVIYAHYLEQTPVREVAALLGLGEKTVEGRLHRARLELRRKLERRARGEEVRR